MTKKPAVPAFLVDYLDKRDAHRADAVNAVLASLTDRERTLVHDAAVMGYVQGREWADAFPWLVPVPAAELYEQWKGERDRASAAA
ncbi:hypothetical protein [Streptomyces kronopolitis]|uniref:hypothetical protein n=1 Tax=Streptomyces kronopolitis TaxID=1612435 RepID=UPI003D95DD43